MLLLCMEELCGQPVESHSKALETIFAGSLMGWSVRPLFLGPLFGRTCRAYLNLPVNCLANY